MARKEKNFKDIPCIKKFLALYSSKNSRTAYIFALKNFFKILNIDPEEYFKQKRDYEEDIRKFFAEIKNRPPKTIRLMLSAVRTFLSENDIELPEKFWRSIRRKIKGRRALTIDEIPSNEQLRRIISHMDVKGKAFFLTLASSGMRIGEALKIKLDDIDLDRKYEINGETITVPTITIRGEYTKTGSPRKAFISKEAKEAIEEWLKIRERYIKTASAKSHRYSKSIDDDRVFPFENNTAYVMWGNALKKAGFDKKDKTTNVTTMHIHVLRKFFRTRMGAVIPVDITEALMGHEGYLTEAYRKYSDSDLAKFYLKGEHSVMIFNEAAEIAKLREEVEQRNKQLQEVVNGVVSENLALKKELQELKKRVKELEDLAHEAHEIMDKAGLIKMGEEMVEGLAKKYQK